MHTIATNGDRLRRSYDFATNLGRNATTWSTTTQSSTDEYGISTYAANADYAEAGTDFASYVTGFIKLTKLDYATGSINDYGKINNTGFNYPCDDDVGDNWDYSSGGL